MMKRLVLTILSVLIICSAGMAGETPAEKELEKAKQDYNKKLGEEAERHQQRVEELTAELVEAYGEAVDRVTKSGDLDLALKLRNEKEQLGGNAKPVSVSLTPKQAILKAYSEVSKKKGKALGKKLYEVKAIFGGELHVGQYFKGFIVYSTKTKTTHVFLLQARSPKQEALGHIAQYYGRNKKGYGIALEGEYVLFDDTYRCHVFGKAVIVWQKSSQRVEAALFAKRFRY